MKLIDAVYEVLKDASKPMHPREIERIVLDRNLFETNGKTLFATIGATLYSDLKKYGGQSRFVKCGKGQFALAGASAVKEGTVKGRKQKVAGISGKDGTAKPSAGYVYILTNPSFRRDWVKIGKTSRKVDVRSAELDNTAVPLPFEVFATMRTVDYEKAERLIHKMIDRFTKKRIRKNREFFNIEPERALEIFEDVQTIFEDAFIERCDAAPAVPQPRLLKKKAHQEDFFLCRGAGANAKAKLTEKGFAVLRGSKISPKTVPSMKIHARSMFELRRELENRGIIVDGAFKQQYVFTSASAAASLVQGRNSNGNTDWRLADGTRFGDVKR